MIEVRRKSQRGCCGNFAGEFCGGNRIHTYLYHSPT
jgi:hypothetical protein